MNFLTTLGALLAPARKPSALPFDARCALAAGSWRPACALALAVALGAGVLYADLGASCALASPAAGTFVVASDTSLFDRAQAETVVAALAGHLRRERGNAEGWRLLARAYSAMQRPADASAAYAQLLALAPDDEAAWASFAAATALSQGRKLGAGQ